MDTNEEFKRLWIDLLSILPKADIPAEAFDSEADYERYIADRNDRGGSTIGTLAEIYVRSLQEQRIANWLWVHSVDRKSTRLNSSHECAYRMQPAARKKKNIQQQHELTHQIQTADVNDVKVRQPDHNRTT